MPPVRRTPEGMGLKIQLVVSHPKPSRVSRQARLLGMLELDRKRTLGVRRRPSGRQRFPARRRYPLEQ
jgi:hypothetical protein